MQRTLIVIALLWMPFAGISTAQEKPSAKPQSAPPPLELRVHKLWESFKKKDKAALSAILDDRFRLFEEGLSAIGDKKAEVNAVDEFDLQNYTLSDFTIKPIGPNAALVTYTAQYEGKSGGEVSKSKSVFGEVWIRAGTEWKAFYMQETYMK
jgi:hypothetical protein